MPDFKPDWPQFFWKGNARIVYEVKIKPQFAASHGLEEITKAVIDPSTQYRSEGLAWESIDYPYREIPDAG